MKQLVLTQQEVILMPTEDEYLHKALMNARFKQAGFDLVKPIEKSVNFDNGDIVYSQKQLNNS